MVKTRIICTLGPASSSVTVLRGLMLAGMDVVRLNFSHGTHEGHSRNIKLVRELNSKYRRRMRILADLEGYRIRIGNLKSGPVELKRGQKVRLTNCGTCGGGVILPFDYEGPLRDIRPGSMIYIDDGNIAIEVTKSFSDRLETEVVVGGLVKEHKGVNIPGVNLAFKGLTDKDKEDLEFVINARVDFVAQSFVRTRADIEAVRKFTNARGFDCPIIAKIENRQGIRNIDGILDAADGIMIARGDMGVSLPIWEVPIVQKQIVARCNKRKEPVIVATQMLESMTENLRPTRAEVSDVANAILDGADYVMLSAETAVGKYPVEAVRMMNSIIKYTEGARLNHSITACTRRERTGR